jgi:hypothetical protein
VEPKRVTRRELLRNIGLVGTAAWAAPALTSTRASASTDRCRKRKARKLCEGGCVDVCMQQPQCGTCSSDVGDGSFCFLRLGDLSCICAEDVFCSETGPCTSDPDCVAQGLGDVCLTQTGCTGCGAGGICSYRCCTWFAGPALARRPRRLGRTAAVR